MFLQKGNGGSCTDVLSINSITNNGWVRYCTLCLKKHDTDVAQ